mmetsp:Transcript_30375/g.76002  ORF Transcript_30375/g.76002 Transcript_30375/m.76002 type:complete len:264 (-) Transcript_30375:364-1155(-)
MPIIAAIGFLGFLPESGPPTPLSTSTYANRSGTRPWMYCWMVSMMVQEQDCPRSSTATTLYTLRRKGGSWLLPWGRNSCLSAGLHVLNARSVSMLFTKDSRSGASGSPPRLRRSTWPSPSRDAICMRRRRRAAGASRPIFLNLAAARVSAATRSVRVNMSMVSSSMGAPLRLMTIDPGCTRCWLFSTSARTDWSSSIRDREDASDGKFWLMSTIIWSGSLARAMRWVACRPRSLMSQTLSASSLLSMATRWSRKEVSSGVRAG